MEQSPLVQVSLSAVLAVIMLGIGLTLRVCDFRRELRAPRGIVIGVAAQALLMPLVGFAIVAAVRPLPAIAVGLMLCAAAPGGTMSNLLAFLARANVALSIVLSVAASIVTVFTLPVAVNLALEWQADTDAAEVFVPLGPTIGLLLGVIVAPVALGMAIRRRAVRRADDIERLISRIGAVVLVLLVVGLAVSLRGEFIDLFTRAGPPILLLNLVGACVGMTVGWAARLPLADRITIAIEIGMKNTALAMIIALTVVESMEAAAVAAIYGFVMFGSALALVGFGRRRGRSDTAAHPARASG